MAESMIARMKHVILLLLGSLAGAALARPVIWAWSHRQIDRWLWWERYRASHGWNREEKREF